MFFKRFFSKAKNETSELLHLKRGTSPRQNTPCRINGIVKGMQGKLRHSMFTFPSGTVVFLLTDDGTEEPVWVFLDGYCAKINIKDVKVTKRRIKY